MSERFEGQGGWVAEVQGYEFQHMTRTRFADTPQDSGALHDFLGLRA